MLQEKGGGTLIVNDHNHLITVIQSGPVFLRTVEGPEALGQTNDNPGMTTTIKRTASWMIQRIMMTCSDSPRRTDCT